MGREVSGLKRTLVAALLGPILGGAIGVTALSMLSAIFWIVRTGEYPLADGAWVTPIVGALLGLILGVPAMLVLGLPAHALLMRLHWRSGFFYAVAGAIAGAIAALLIGQTGVFNLFNSDLPPEVEKPSDFMAAVSALPAAAIFGAFCALGFWFFRQPDLDVKNVADNGA